MSLKNYSHEEKKQMPMVELANLLLSDKQKAIPFKELFEEVTDLKEFTDGQKQTYISQFYTDLNLEGRFINTGSNVWALKRWYPVDQVMKETKPAEKKKPKAKKKPVKKQEPEAEEEETETTETNDSSLEELTGDFSSFDGKDDVDEEEDLDIFSEDMDIDEDFDDDELDDDEFDDEDETENDDNSEEDETSHKENEESVKEK